MASSVLLISANEECLQMVFKMLKLRYPSALIDVATNEADALSKLEQKHHDIVVSDLFFGGQEKSSFLYSLCRVCQDLRTRSIIIAVTADTELTRACPYISECEVHEVLHKPVQIDELFRILDTVMVKD